MEREAGEGPMGGHCLLKKGRSLRPKALDWGFAGGETGKLMSSEFGQCLATEVVDRGYKSLIIQSSTTN